MVEAAGIPRATDLSRFGIEAGGALDLSGGNAVEVAGPLIPPVLVKAWGIAVSLLGSAAILSPKVKYPKGGQAIESLIEGAKSGETKLGSVPVELVAANAGKFAIVRELPGGDNGITAFASARGIKGDYEGAIVSKDEITFLTKEAMENLKGVFERLRPPPDHFGSREPTDEELDELSKRMFDNMQDAAARSGETVANLFGFTSWQQVREFLRGIQILPRYQVSIPRNLDQPANPEEALSPQEASRAITERLKVMEQGDFLIVTSDPAEIQDPETDVLVEGGPGAVEGFRITVGLVGYTMRRLDGEQIQYSGSDANESTSVDPTRQINTSQSGLNIYSFQSGQEIFLNRGLIIEFPVLRTEIVDRMAQLMALTPSEDNLEATVERLLDNLDPADLSQAERQQISDHLLPIMIDLLGPSAFSPAEYLLRGWLLGLQTDELSFIVRPATNSSDLLSIQPVRELLQEIQSIVRQHGATLEVGDFLTYFKKIFDQGDWQWVTGSGNFLSNVDSVDAVLSDFADALHRVEERQEYFNRIPRIEIRARYLQQSENVSDILTRLEENPDLSNEELLIPLYLDAARSISRDGPFADEPDNRYMAPLLPRWARAALGSGSIDLLPADQRAKLEMWMRYQDSDSGGPSESTITNVQILYYFFEKINDDGENTQIMRGIISETQERPRITSDTTPSQIADMLDTLGLRVPWSEDDNEPGG